MSEHRNNVANAVSGTPGTGTITLASAVSGSQSFATAYGANATVDVFITDGTAWEVARNCAYTHSGTTLTRGTLEASSTGSAISLTSAAVVRVAASADSGRRWDAAALDHATGADAATSMAANTMYVVDIGAWATANRTYTLPATAAVGDRVGILTTSANSTYKLNITAASGDTLDGVSGGTVWSSLYNADECIVMRCVTANAAWVVESAKWVENEFSVTANGSTTQTLTRNVSTKISAVLTTEASDTDSLWDNTNDTFTARRPGLYLFKAAIQVANMADTKGVQILLYKNGSASVGSAFITASGTSSPVMQLTAGVDLEDGGTVELYCYHEDAAVNRATTGVASNNYISGIRLGQA